MWREAPEDLRQSYIQEEFAKRQEYKAAMVDWRKQFDEDKRVERQNREDMALRTAEAMEHHEKTTTGEDDGYRQASYADHNYYGAIPQSVPSGRGMSEAYGTMSAHAAHSNFSPYGASELGGFPFFAMPPQEGHTFSQLHDFKYLEANGVYQQPLASLMSKAWTSWQAVQILLLSLNRPFFLLETWFRPNDLLIGSRK